jgi:hypothetical protein
LRQRTYTGKKVTFNGVKYDSKQEKEFHQGYLESITYHPEIAIPYRMDFIYRPDFRLGVDKVTGKPVYLEAKEYFDSEMVAKYASIAICTPGIILLILTPNIKERDRIKLCDISNIDVIVTKSVVPQRWVERLGW